MSTTTAQTTQVYSVFIKAAPEQIWDAITKPEFTQKYFHGTLVEIAPDGYRSKGSDGDDVVTGATIEVDPPRRLVHGWRALYDEALANEPESRVTWEIEPREDGVSLLTVTHDKLESSPLTAEGVSGTGWMWVLSGLKSLLETGEPLSA